MDPTKEIDLPTVWACERCGKIVPILDTCLVDRTLEIICEDCEAKRIAEPDIDEP